MSDLFSLTGQTAVITGAARGIGQAMAIGLAEAGADIILILRNESQQETKTAIEALGRKCSIYTADLSVASALDGLIERISKAHEFQILVNVAGVMRRIAAHEFPDEIFDEVLQTNLKATFKLCKDTGKYWIDQGIKGSIINTGSLASFQGGVNMAAYAVSKGGVHMLTKALSNEWAGKGIRVNAVAPGYIATDMNLDTRTNQDTTYYDSITTRIPAGRWGEPNEFKGVVVFLASQASTYLTGQSIVVDGGWMAR